MRGVLVFAWWAASLLAGRASGDVRPNLLVITADDMGYSDAGCFGGEIATPVLDRLSQEGVRLTHCFNGGMCVISRVSLMPGQWWRRESGEAGYTPKSTKIGPNYRPQGDRGSGSPYGPSAMPAGLAARYPLSVQR